MEHCPNCKEEFKCKSKFCTKCGADLREYYVAEYERPTQ